MTHRPGWGWEPAKRLDRVAHEVALAWDLRLGPRYDRAHYSFAAPAGDHAVLKLTPPEDDDAANDADALAFWDGRGAVRLLRRDPARHAMLIERCVPGHDASALDDREAIRVAIDVGRELWRRVPTGPFRDAGPAMAGWLRDLATRTDHPLLRIAAARFAAMTPRHEVLVHGDYHHHNLLRHAGRWLAIDPKPFIADPEFDVATLLWNPLQLTLTPDGTERRIAQLAAGGLDAGRIRDWAVVRGTQLGLPLERGQDEASVRQLRVARWLVERETTSATAS
jgi:streptomycin 6-kinase